VVLTFAWFQAEGNFPRPKYVIVAQALKSVGAPAHASLGILSDVEFRLLKDAGSRVLQP
jgi:hypothetical protein